ncbi:hypothetical protein [Brumimicrobium aurantiacum]|uniref:Uncharacterized protein n=1 Tax=Brumimicrobium aurantiacum TaxID=1737063 RepID=A0A3E1F1G1_9FLAO|nr:hypothetical protein [Brumimicrobium aurantiacum]RFC55583.1 hypothetical protein DXU93_01235 [Brumimicrobium aurantiacum]
MRKSTTVKFISAVIITSAVVAFFVYFLKNKNDRPFQLINQVEQANIIYHANLEEMVDEAILFNNNVTKKIGLGILLGKIKNTLETSGIKSENAFLTHDFYQGNATTLYAEITDQKAFEKSFELLATLFQLDTFNQNPSLFLSKNLPISAVVKERYIKLTYGNTLPESIAINQNPLNSFFKNTLSTQGIGIINTANKSTLDSTDFATFSYTSNDDFQLFIDWQTKGPHPLKKHQDSVLIYNSEKNVIQSFFNVDSKHFKRYSNSYLSDLGYQFIDNFDSKWAELLSQWTGNASIQLGGREVKKKVQYITEFDDNFNQIEKEVITIDSVLDIGIFWESKEIESALNTVFKLPNVNQEKDKLHIALLPPLETEISAKNVKAAINLNKFKKFSSPNILQLSITSPELNGEITLHQQSVNKVLLKVEIKDWLTLDNPKELILSNLW